MEKKIKINIEPEIYPINIEIDQQNKNRIPLINWENLLYKWLHPNLKTRFITLSSKFEYKEFLKGVNKEYGINNVKKNLKEALSIYTFNADYTTDSVSMYKMFQIYLHENKKFNIKRNRNLEYYYLFKCYAYSPFQVLRGYINFMGIIELYRVILYLFDTEDNNYDKFFKLMDYMDKKGNKYNILKSDIDLIKAVFYIKIFERVDEGISILKKLAEKGNKEAIYKLACFSISNDKDYAKKLFEELKLYKYYKCYNDYGKFLFEELNEKERALEIFKEGFENGNYYCFFCYYDAFLYTYDMKIFENGKNVEIIKLFLNILINDILIGGLFSYFEFFFLRKISLKHFKIDQKIIEEYDIYTVELCKFLSNIIKPENKKFLDNNFSKDIAECEFNLSYGYLKYLGINGIIEKNLDLSFSHIKHSFKTSENRSYKRFCYSFIYKLRTIFYQNKIIEEKKLLKSGKKLFDLYNISLQEGNLNDFSSSFYYYLAKLYEKGIGTKKDNYYAYIYYYQATQPPIKYLGTGSIISYYRKYKTDKILLTNQFKMIIDDLNNIKISDDNEGYGDGSICPICYDKKRTCVIIPCKHKFCDNCMEILKENKKCPLCRGKIILVRGIKN
jgi:hypothetical protein